MCDGMYMKSYVCVLCIAFCCARLVVCPSERQGHSRVGMLHHWHQEEALPCVKHRSKYVYINYPISCPPCSEGMGDFR